MKIKQSTTTTPWTVIQSTKKKCQPTAKTKGERALRVPQVCSIAFAILRAKESKNANNTHEVNHDGHISTKQK